MESKRSRDIMDNLILFVVLENYIYSKGLLPINNFMSTIYYLDFLITHLNVEIYFLIFIDFVNQ